MYCEAVTQHTEDGHARPIDEEEYNADKIRYLPYHSVFREDRATTKCRVVLDSSAKTYDVQSLNSCLLKGPKLQPDLGHVLIRFSFHRVGIMADIKKMFLQTKLKRQDQNSHRFLWRDLHIHREPEIYCMTRVTFEAPSPSFPLLQCKSMRKNTRNTNLWQLRKCAKTTSTMYSLVPQKMTVQ